MKQYQHFSRFKSDVNPFIANNTFFKINYSELVLHTVFTSTRVIELHHVNRTTYVLAKESKFLLIAVTIGSKRRFWPRTGTHVFGDNLLGASVEHFLQF